MVKFAKVIINKSQNEYRNIHFLQEILNLMKEHKDVLYDDYFSSENLAQDLIRLVESCRRFFWAIVDDNGRDLLGFAYFDNFIGNQQKLHSAEINTCFKRKCWGKPVREISKRFLKFCFKKYGFEKIKATVFRQNSMVKGLLSCLGFKKEGLLIGETFKNGKLQDVEIYSVRKGRLCKKKK